MPSLNAARWGTNGVLAGAPVLIDIQVLSGFVPQYTEVTNTDTTNSYTCTIEGVVYYIPPGLTLKVPGDCPTLTLNGTGGYVVLASRDYGSLPSLVPANLNVTSATSLYTADEDTLTLDALTHVFSVKDRDAGLNTGLLPTKVLQGLHKDWGMTGYGMFHSNINCVAGDTLLIQVGGVISQLFRCVAGAPVDPRDFTVGANSNASLISLAAVASSIWTSNEVVLIVDGDYLDVYCGSTALLGLPVTVAGTWGIPVALTATERVQRNIALYQFEREVTATDVTRTSINLGIPNCTHTPIACHVQLKSAAGAVLPAWDPIITLNTGFINISIGAVAPFAPGEIMTVTATAEVDS